MGHAYYTHLPPAFLAHRPPDGCGRLSLSVSADRSRRQSYFPERTGLVIHWHSEIVAQQRTGRMLAPLIKRCLQRADRIIVSTPYHVEISPYLTAVADKCVVIPFGIDLARWGQLTPRTKMRSNRSGRN